ncbi:MAG: putative Tic20 family protein [Candidatus Aldehydirespiratoraceae bacterium]|jgi:uncharacterized Tic20 family protein
MVRVNNNTMPMLAHLLGLFTSFVGPLIIFLIVQDDSPYARQQAAEALNFQITLIISYIVSFALMLVLIGFLTIMASVAAYRGEPYRYPINICFVS